MHRSPTYRWIAAVAVLAAVVLAGCGSSGGDGGAKTTAGGAAAAVTVEGVSLRQDPQLHAALPPAVRAQGSLSVAIDAPFPPYAVYDGSTLTGFEPQLGAALGALLGVRFDFQKQPFDGIIPALQARKYDLVLSAMTDTKEREKLLDFVDHSLTGLTIVVAKGNPQHITTLTDLCGKTVAVQKGTTDELFLDSTDATCKQAGKPPIGKQSYPRESNAMLAVTSGKTVADFVDGAVGGYAVSTMQNGNALETIVDPKAPHGYRSNPVGIGMLKGQPQLRDAIRAALAQLVGDGVYRKLLATWHMQNNDVGTVTVNAGG